MDEKSEKKKRARKGAWWRKYTKEFLDEPQPIPLEQPIAHRPLPKTEKKIIFPRFTFKDPFSEIERVQREMDRIFKDTFRRSFFGFPTFPRIVKLNEGIFRKSMVEVKDLGKQIAVRAEMPGVKKEDIKVRIEGRNLILDARAQKKQEKKEETVQSFSQRFVGFRNVIRLPTEVNRKTARAKYENGILTVILEKKESPENGDITIE